MSAQTLRAEARAWRRAAETLDDAIPRPRRLTFDTAPMMLRWCEHEVEMFGGVRDWAVTLPMLDMVLACLILALECEDEARALGRGGQ